MGKKTVFLAVLLLAILLLVSCAGEEVSKQNGASETNTNSPPLSMDSVEVNDNSVKNLVYQTNINHSERGIGLASASRATGTLLVINEKYGYRYLISTLTKSSDISSAVSFLEEQNLVRLYGRKSQNYLLASSAIFLKEDAFQPWEDMMADFVADTGKKTVQVVSAYSYNGEESLNSLFVTGYMLAVNLYENGANYSLSSSEKTVTVKGKVMTCLDWFQDNCARYGFVYTGLEGTQAKTLATFRYVGVPHALAMQKLDYVDTKEYSDFLRNQTETFVVMDSEKAIEWKVGFYSANTDGTQTSIMIPKGAVYTVSGNNIDGFVVAYYIHEV